MIRADCDSVRDDLDAFADGELRGDDLRYVAQHVDMCVRCTEEVEVRRAVGGLIRDSASHWHPASAPTGLASGVVARVRAESAVSWRAVLNRAVEDWHYVIVGGGALAATFVSMLICSALLILGTTARSGDSLSAMGTNLKSSPGQLYAEVSRQGARGDEVMFVQLDTSAAPSDAVPAILTRESDERQLVNALAETLRGGGPLDLSVMSKEDRLRAEWLLQNIARRRGIEPGVGPMNTLKVYRLHLVTNTEVTAKGLWP